MELGVGENGRETYTSSRSVAYFIILILIKKYVLN